MENKSSSKLQKITDFTERLWHNRWYFLALIAFATVFVFLDKHPLGIMVLLLVASWFLIFCDDIMACVMPILMVCLMVGSKYEHLEAFIPCIFFLIPTIAAIVIHLIRWPKKIVLGKTFRGVLLVAIATLLGGIGTITLKEYFSPLSLYYTLGLGVLLLILYLIFRSQIEREFPYDLKEKFAQILFATGIFMTIIIIGFYYLNWHVLITERNLLFIRYRNFAAAILLTTMPASFYLAMKKKGYLIGGVIMFITMILTESRSALIFGAVEVVIGCVYLVYYKVVKLRPVIITAIICIALGAIGLIFFYSKIRKLYSNRADLGDFKTDPKRLEIYQRGFNAFFKHPIFGIGLGNRMDEDLMGDLVSGSMVFYHNLFLQAAASMGALGLVAYVLQVFDRFKLIIVKRNPFVLAMGLCYLGMFMITMVNPGELCPMPNAGLIVLLFAVIEVAD